MEISNEPDGDVLLSEFLGAPEAAEMKALERLLCHALARIEPFLARKANASERCDIEDVVAEVCQKLQNRLMYLKTHPGMPSIANFNAYAFRMARNQWSEYLRKKRKQGLRIEVDSQDLDEGPGCVVDVPPSQDYEPYLQFLWQAISSLQFEWRFAFLLGSKDVVWDFSTFGVASITDIAAVLRMTADNFAEIANRLPLSGGEIATLLGARTGTTLGEKQINSYRWHARTELVKLLEARLGIKVKKFAGGGNTGLRYASLK